MYVCGSVETANSSIIWKLNNFSLLLSYPAGTIISSPMYTIGNSQWKIDLYPSQPTDFISIYLTNKYWCEFNMFCNFQIEASFQFSILDRFKQKAYSRPKLPRTLFNKDNFAWGDRSYISKDFLLSKKDTLLFEDNLIILCEIHMDSQFDENFILHPNLTNQVLQDFESLFLNENFADLIIVVDNKKLFVHKNILSARSKVFCVMLEHNMKERNTNSVEITDASYEVMKEVLRYIYCGKIENIEKLADLIIPVAEKYDLDSLKSLCADFLWKTLDNEKACDTLHLAETYNCYDLKSKVIKYIITNIKEVTITTGFEELKTLNSKLLGDILFELGQK